LQSQQTFFAGELGEQRATFAEVKATLEESQKAFDIRYALHVKEMEQLRLERDTHAEVLKTLKERTSLLGQTALSWQQYVDTKDELNDARDAATEAKSTTAQLEARIKLLEQEVAYKDELLTVQQDLAKAEKALATAATAQVEILCDARGRA
jgi:hypothetical protein